MEQFARHPQNPAVTQLLKTRPAMSSDRISAASLLCFIAAAAPLSAQDGGQLFALNCSACHGADGKGATGGAFPPLAGSPWLAGKPDRAIKIALHGLAGPVKVLGKTYNLEMPPQGAALADDQLAAILTFVRSSWGNKAAAVTPDVVKDIRAATAKRDKHWTAPEILKLHPLDEKPPLTDLVSHVYSGTWSTVPEFSHLKPSATEEERGGLISLRKIGKKKNFGVVWEGNLAIAETGDYDFQLAADDGGWLWIDGKPLVEIKGIGPSTPRAKQGTAALEPGAHKLRVEYFQLKGKKEIHVGWRKSGVNFWQWLSDEEVSGGKTWPEIMLKPEAGRAVIYRNFISKTTPRAIGVGFPGGINLAYSGDDLAPELVWTGNFIDAGHHWTDRGIGNEPPAGKRVVKLTSGPVFPEGATAHGYILDAAGNPTFSTTIGSLRVLDSYHPAPPDSLVRLVKVGGSASSAAVMKLADKATAGGAPGTYQVAGGMEILAPAARLADGALVLPLAPDSSTEIRYIWK